VEHNSVGMSSAVKSADDGRGSSSATNWPERPLPLTEIREASGVSMDKLQDSELRASITTPRQTTQENWLEVPARSGLKKKTQQPLTSGSSFASSSASFAAAGLRGRRVSNLNAPLVSPRNTSTMVGPGSRLSDDDFDIGAMMTSLIDTKGIDGAWSKLSRRMTKIEHSCQQVQEKIDGWTKEYVRRDEFEQMLDEVSGGLEKRLDGARDAKTRFGAVVQDQAPALAEFKSEIERKEQSQLIAFQEAVEVARKAEETQAHVTSELKAAALRATQRIAEQQKEKDKLEGHVEKKLAAAYKSMADLEARMRDFAQKEVQRATRELLFAADSTPPGTLGLTHQDSMQMGASGSNFAFGITFASPLSTPSRTPVGSRPATHLGRSNSGAPDVGTVPRISEAAELVEAHQATFPHRPDLPTASPRMGTYDPTAEPVIINHSVPAEQWRAQLLEFVNTALVVPALQQVKALSDKMDKQKDELIRQIRFNEKSSIALAERVHKVVRDQKEDVEGRKTEFARLESMIQEVYPVLQRVEEKVTECADEGSKQQEATTIEVTRQSSLLQSHQKELDQCPSQKDLRTLRADVGRCITKEAFKREKAAIKTELDYHTDKLDHMAMAAMGPSAAKSRARKTMSSKNLGPKLIGSEAQKREKSMEKSKSSKKLEFSPEASLNFSSESLAQVSTEAGTAQASLDSLMQESTEKKFKSPIQPGVLWSQEDQEGFVDEEAGSISGKRTLDSRVVQEPGTSEDDNDFEEEADQEEEEEEEDKDEDWGDDPEDDASSSPGEVQLREQVECSVMALLCLAQHLLRGPPQTGLSRQARLMNEKELLSEIMSLRHWVTNRSLPGGWTPDKLLTLSLRYSHPRPDEVHGPQPHVQYGFKKNASAKQLLSQSDAKGEPSDPEAEAVSGGEGPLQLQGGGGSQPGGGGAPAQTAARVLKPSSPGTEDPAPG